MKPKLFIIGLCLLFTACAKPDVYNLPTGYLDASIITSSKVIPITIAIKSMPEKGVIRLTKKADDKGATYVQDICYESIEYIGKKEYAPYNYAFVLHDVTFIDPIDRTFIKGWPKGWGYELVSDRRLIKDCPATSPQSK